MNRHPQGTRGHTPRPRYAYAPAAGRSKRTRRYGVTTFPPNVTASAPLDVKDQPSAPE